MALLGGFVQYSPADFWRVYAQLGQAVCGAGGQGGANLGIGLGALFGGHVIDTYGLGSLGFAGAGFILVSIILASLLMAMKPRAACA